MQHQTKPPAPPYPVGALIKRVAIGALIFALACELLVRVFNPTPKFQVVRDGWFNPVLYEVGGVPLWRDYDPQPRWNESCAAEHPERERLLIFGSSILYGSGLSAEDAVSAHLQLANPSMCVMNFAQPGSTMQTKLARAEEAIPRHPGSKVLLEIWQNDPFDYELLGSAAYSLRGATTDSQDYPAALGIPAPLNGLMFRRSAVYEYATLALSEPVMEDQNKLWPVSVLPKLDRILALAQDNDSTLELVFMPKLASDPITKIADISTYGLVAQWAQERGVPWVDAGELLAKRSVVDIRLDPCCHLNPLGQHLLAEGLERTLLAPALEWSPVCAAGAPTAWLISNVGVFDSRTGRVVPNQDVLLDAHQGPTILAMGPTGTVNGAGAITLDGAGHTLIPGFVDASVHVLGPLGPPWSPVAANPSYALDSWLAAGVTTVWDLDGGGELDTHRALAPHIVHAVPDVGPWARVSGASPGPLQAAIASVQATDLLAVVEVSTEREAKSAAVADIQDGMVSFGPVRDATLETMSALDTHVIPRVAALQATADLADGAWVPTPWDAALHPQLVGPLTGRVDQVAQELAKNSVHWDRTIDAMEQLDVPLLIGTGAPQPGVLPGSSFHRELDRLHSAGLPMAKLLRAATIEPAKMLADPPESGVVEAGMPADLLMVMGNPLTDPAAVHRVTDVFLGGVRVERDVGRLP